MDIDAGGNADVWAVTNKWVTAAPSKNKWIGHGFKTLTWLPSRRHANGYTAYADRQPWT